MVSDILAPFLENNVMSAASWVYGDRHGFETGGIGEADPHSRFDLASLTKLLCTTMLCKKLSHDGYLSLDAPFDQMFQNLPSGLTWTSFLEHRTGLPAYLDPQPEESMEEFKNRIINLPISDDRSTLYSCLNFVYLQWAIEMKMNSRIDALFEHYIVPEFQFQETHFGADATSPPTEIDGKLLVHDPLARKFGGMSGNAGLFGSALDLGRFCQTVLSDHPIFGIDSWEGWLPLSDREKSRGLGWDRKAPADSSAGSWMSRNTFGHTGFTGTMVWIDFQNKSYLALLTNAVLYCQSRSDILNMRQIFANSLYSKF